MTSIGVVGLGIMGSAMAGHLMNAGYRVVGYDVRTARAGDLRASGGVAAKGCGDVSRQARIIITSLPSAEALTQTVDDLRAVARPRQIVVETSTLPLEAKVRARRRLRASGIELLDCPISGTGSQARDKDIVVYASGTRRAYGRVSIVLDAFTRAHYFVGPFGDGSKVKFVANLLVAIHNVAAAEALVLAMKAGLDAGTVLELITQGAGSSRVLQLRGPMMVKGDYRNATMTLATWQKDMAIIAEFARQVGSATPLFSATAPIYASARTMNASHDTAAVCAVLERMAHHRRPARPRRRRATST
ncbi:MAG TPA: NAD(P)-dependent oxidoreductase [Vicinamibacterales bacterium]|nr:NAD(P)-dependent oxidoreductase [Vicinamibacterales bacterium]